MQVIYNFAMTYPYLIMFIVSMISVIIQRHMPAAVPYLGAAKKTIKELTVLNHYHISTDTNEIKEKALKEGLKLAAKALDIEMNQDRRKNGQD